MKTHIIAALSLSSQIAFGEMVPSDMSMAMFNSGRVTEPTVFKVEIRVAPETFVWDSQIEQFRSKFWAVCMFPVHDRGNMGATGFYCYVKKDSDVGETIGEALKDGSLHRAMVRIRYSDKQEFDRCCVMDEIEMITEDTSEDLDVKFGATRIGVTKSKEYDYLQGKIAVTIRSRLKVFSKPILRVVLLTDENGSRVVRDSIIDEPDIKVLSQSDSIERDTTTAGNDQNEPCFWHKYIEEISANQSEVSAERYKSVSYVGLPLGSRWRRGVKGDRLQHMFGYCKFDKQENAKMLGYRIEMWYKGGCVAVYDTLRTSDIRKLAIPDDWHVSFKHPQKFKYRSPFSNKAAVRY